jgi:hypothetical protein
MIGMAGLLNAHMNLQTASKIQHIANSTVQDGRIRVRQGMTSGDAKAVEEGMALQARGEETRIGVFQFLGSALDDVSAAAKECEEAAKERQLASDEINLETPSGGKLCYATDEFDAYVGDTINGSGYIRIPTPEFTDAVPGYTVRGSGCASVPVIVRGVNFSVAV